MKSRGLVGRSLLVMKHLGGVKRLRQQMRIVLLVGTAMVVLGSSPTTAQISGFTPVFEQTTASNPAANVAIEGDAAATTGVNIGVMGTTASTGGLGVRGFATATSGQNFGAVGRSDSPQGTGVLGNATATTCPFITFPETLGSTCAGVFGQSLATSGNTAGVVGRTQSQHGNGVAGFATATSGLNSGVFGQNDSPSGIGVFGLATATGFFGFPPQGAFGVVGRSDSPFGTGVFGNATGPAGIGIQASGSLAGLFSGPVRIDGNLTVSGSKAALVDTVSYGKRQLYAVESPESWFEDFGGARLTNGRAIVRLDPIFAQTVSTEEYHVFLTPKGDCKGLYVANQRATSFEVKELQNGKSSIAFDYRIVAKRKGYERARLPEPTK